jgi:hypothetical protein
MTSIKDAIKNWEAREAKKAADAGLPEPPKAPDAERVMLYVLPIPTSDQLSAKSLTRRRYGQLPPIQKMDNTLGTLKACKHLALSSNAIDRIAGLKGMDSIKSLCVTRHFLETATALINLNLLPLQISMTLCFQVAWPQPNQSVHRP